MAVTVINLKARTRIAAVPRQLRVTVPGPCGLPVHARAFKFAHNAGQNINAGPSKCEISVAAYKIYLVTEEEITCYMNRWKM